MMTSGIIEVEPLTYIRGHIVLTKGERSALANLAAVKL
jgi:predicted ribonuclease YlaK